MYHEQPVVETSAEELLRKGRVVYSEEDVAGRVVFVSPNPEFLGNRENHHFTRYYPTHCETWHLVQADDPRGDISLNVYKRYGFQDRKGQWWMLWHDFQHTQKLADGHAAVALQDCTSLEEPFYQYIL